MISKNKRVYIILIVTILTIQFSIASLIDPYIFPFSPLNNISVKNSIEDDTSKKSYSLKNKQIPYQNLDDKDLIFSNTPYIHFSIKYTTDTVDMEILLENNIGESITFFNFWIQVNKSVENEYIELSNTKIADIQNKLSLSTFDKTNQMVFHIKLFEGEMIEPNEKYMIKLKWYDPDGILAQYDPDLLYNKIIDDIQAFLQYSTRIEQSQLFPMVERVYSQEIMYDKTYYNVDFRIINLMDNTLDTFNFTYVKIKAFTYETYKDFEVISPFLTESEKSQLYLNYFETDDEIEFRFSLGNSILLEPNEWLLLKTQWSGQNGFSSITNDFVYWNIGKKDGFNANFPFYYIGFPFYPLLTPAEPIVTLDYDLDGLRNRIEMINELDPKQQNSWLYWNSLRGDYSLSKNYANNLDLEGKISIFIPHSLSQGLLTMKIEELGSYDTIQKVKLNNQKIFDSISAIGQYNLANPADKGAYNLKFTLSHNLGIEDSVYKINFLLNGEELMDLSSYLVMDSDGDGLYDNLEEIQYTYRPDADSDGIFDGIDLLLNKSLSFNAMQHCRINFPINDLDGKSEIAINLQIKPTSNDFTDVLPYRGNELKIIPGIRIYSKSMGGDDLPDNSFSIDNGQTGIVILVPMKREVSDEMYSWSATFTYKYNNLAKSDRQIMVDFTLVWLILEYNPISEETNLFHIYENNDPFILQGIAITESEPIKVIMGLIDDGSSYRKTIIHAELLAHLYFSDISYNPIYISGLQSLDGIVNDLDNLNLTRNKLRNNLLNSNNLQFEDTYFIYITSSYSSTYNLQMLYDVFGEQNPSRAFTDQEIDYFYSLPQNIFMGVFIPQILYQNDVEFLGEAIHSLKQESAITRLYNLNFILNKYAGSSCENIFIFEGYVETNYILINYYDFKTSELITTLISGGNYDLYSNLKVLKFEIMGPKIPGQDVDFGLCIFLWEGLGLIFEFFITEIFSNFLDVLDLFKLTYTIFREIDTLGKFGKFLDCGALDAIGKFLGVVNIIFGGMKIFYGINLFLQGAYKTGLAEGIRGGLMVTSGILALIPEPTGITKALAIGILVFQLFDWIALTFFEFDFWNWFLGFFFQIEDANPDYRVLSSGISFNNLDKIKRQGGLRVGDSLNLIVEFENIGNTQLTWGIEIKAGSGDYGQHRSLTKEAGHSGSLTASDSFETPSPLTLISIIVDVSWYYDPPGKWVVNPIPPFIWWIDPPPSSGGPEYSDPQIFYFDLPIFPETINDFIGLLESGNWLPPFVPLVYAIQKETEIIPLIKEDLLYTLYIFNIWPSTLTYEIIAPTSNLWNFDFYNDGSFENSIIVEMPFLAVYNIPIKIYPSIENRLTPGNHHLLIRVQQKDLTLARKDIRLNYKVQKVYEFNVNFDPQISAVSVLDYGDTLTHTIKVQNKGNVPDSYHIDVIGLDPDLYTLYKPDLTAGIQGTDSSLIIFQIPYYKIIPEGDFPYKIRITSSKNTKLVKEYDYILHINEYHRVDLKVHESAISMTDGDTAVYQFELINLGNVEEHYTITYDEISFANFILQENEFSLDPGEIKNFKMNVTPLELGYETFYLRAISPILSDELLLSLKVIDDDTTSPEIQLNYEGGDSTDANPGYFKWTITDKDDGIGGDYDTGFSSIDIRVNYKSSEGLPDEEYIVTPNELGSWNLPPYLGVYTIMIFAVDNDDDRYYIVDSLSKELSSSQEVYDDDINLPQLSDIIITHDIHQVNISFNAIDESGIDDIVIFINGVKVEPLKEIREEDTYRFIIPNQWILKNGIYDVEIQVTDSDNDRPNDKLTAIILSTFEISLKDIYEYVDWQLEQLKKYIDENLCKIFRWILIQKLINVQKNLQKAYYLIEKEKITYGLFHDHIAKFLLMIAEFRAEIFNKINIINDDDAEYINNYLHDIRNNIVILIGASVGKEQAYNIALIEIRLHTLSDLIKEEINWCNSQSVINQISSATRCLEFAIIKLSMKCNVDYELYIALWNLELAKSHINWLLKRGKISQELAERLLNQIENIQAEIEIVKNSF